LCPADGVDLADEDRIRRLVRTFVLPGDRTRTSTDHTGGVERIDRPPRSSRPHKGEAS
jgi:hypothetical protein